MREGQSPATVVERFRQIVDHAQQYNNVRIIIAGIIPQLNLSEEKETNFRLCSEWLRKMCNGYNNKNVNFFNVAKVLTVDGVFPYHFWRPDQLHLSRQGAERVAHELMIHIRNM